MQRVIRITLLICLSSLSLGPSPAWSDSLYQHYITTDNKQLDAESSRIRRGLRDIFNSNSISEKQQEVDFHQYLSALKKAVFYGTKLASYINYEEDMRFARDHELFQAIPQESTLSPNLKNEKDTYLEHKYRRMNKNIQEEIETYIDEIKLNLDDCESLAGNGLNDFTANNNFRDKMAMYINSAAVQKLNKQRSGIESRWPETATRIFTQLQIWMPKDDAGDIAIINPNLIQAL